ncbi:hypothetical protein K4K58_004259 [Colletotrichum sp. SAR11_239]|nr:hypothetical protein K4K58_004259 [Colletotrichum sp. SAR11_239]
MMSKLSSSPAPEWLGSKDQESISEMISEIRRGVHTVWGGIGASEERKLRNVLQKLVDDVGTLEIMLSSTTKRRREGYDSVIDTKRHKTHRSSEEPSHHNKNSVSPPHIAADAYCKTEKIEDDVDLISTTSFNPVVDLTSNTTSDEESHQASTTSWVDAFLASAATVNEQCGHENDTYATRRRPIEKEDDDSSEEEACDATVKPQGAHQDESPNAIEVWFRDKVHRGHEILGLLALLDFHESDPANCKAGSESCQNVRRKVEAAEHLMGYDWEKTVGPLARVVSWHLKDAGEDLEDVLKRFQDHAKKIEPQPDWDDLLLDNAECIDRFRPSKKHHAYELGVERLPASTLELFVPSHRQARTSSSCRPHATPRIVESTPTQAKKSQDVAYLSKVSTMSPEYQTSHKSGRRSQPETTESCRIFSNSKKVHWDVDKKIDSDSRKDLSENRSTTSDEDDSDESSDQEPESDGDEYSEEDDGGEDLGNDDGCNNVSVSQNQIELLTTMLEEHDRQKEPGSYCSGEHEDLEHGLQMCWGFADEKTGEMMIDRVAYDIAEHLYEFGLSPRKTLKGYITRGKNCEWSPWSKEESVAARKLKPWFRERAWYSIKH